MKTNQPESITGCVLYAVRNSEGKWFRRKGYGGGGDSWVDKFDKARIYAKIGHARAIVSYWSENYSSYPTPIIVSLMIDRIEVLDESKRIAELKIKKAQAELKRKEREVKYRVESAQREYDRAKNNLNQFLKNS